MTLPARKLRIAVAEWFLPLLEHYRYKGIFGGRGTGKSHAVAEYIIGRSVSTKTDTVCSREIQSSLRQSVKRLLEIKIEQMGVGRLFEIQRDQIICPHGGLIIFQGVANQTAESIKSLENFDILWFEEAQSCSQRSLDLLRPTFRKPGSEMIFTWNPRFPSDPVDALLRSGQLPPRSRVIEVGYRDNPWFPPDLREEMEYDKRRDPDKYAHIWLGGYQRNSESRVFRNWRVEDFETPPDVVHRFGADFGFAADPTVLIRCHIVSRSLYIDYEVYRIGCEIVDMPDLFMQIPGSEQWPLIADSARPETISHLRKHGFPKIMSATKGKDSIREGVEWLKSYEIIVHPRCVHVADELALYSYKKDPVTEKILPILEDKSNHCIDALRYACEGVRRAVHKKPVDAAPIPTRRYWT